MQLEIMNQNLFEVDNKYYLAHCIALDFRLGAGIALEFQKRFNLREKLKSCPYDKYVGSCILIDKVFNLITKERSNGKPTYGTLEDSLRNMKRLIQQNEIKYLAMPRIGCGLDGLNWHIVLNTIENIFYPVDIQIKVCIL